MLAVGFLSMLFSHWSHYYLPNVQALSLPCYSWPVSGASSLDEFGEQDNMDAPESSYLQNKHNGKPQSLGGLILSNYALPVFVRKMHLWNMLSNVPSISVLHSNQQVLAQVLSGFIINTLWIFRCLENDIGPDFLLEVLAMSVWSDS